MDGWGINNGMAGIALLTDAAQRNFVWIGLSLGLLLMAGILAYVLVRKRLHGDKDAFTSSDTEVFTMEQLRRLHRDGRISDGEFEVMKNKIIRDARL